MSGTLSPSVRTAPELSRLDDLALVVLAAADHDSPAEQILVLRHHDWATRRVRWLARRQGLSPTDTEDAVQDSFFALHKAIARYDLVQADRPGGCLFRAFLSRLLTDRFKDFVKHLRRRGRCQPFSTRGDDDPAAAAGDPPDHRTTSDPEAAAENKELATRLHAAADRMAGDDRAILERYLAGTPLRDIADGLGLSYDATKHRWHAVRKHLARTLRSRESEPGA